MHYANGQPAKLWDLVVLRRKPEQASATEIIGVLRYGNAKATGCNGQIQAIAAREVSDLGTGHWTPANPGMHSVTIGELMPIEIPEVPITEIETAEKQSITIADVGELKP